MSFVLTTTELTKRYGKLTAVDKLNLQIPKGSVYGILGPNGSGKTTTLGMILGATIPSSGSFSWFDSGDAAHHRTRIGSLLEKPNFLPNLNAVKNLKIIAEVKGCGYSNIDDSLRITGLFDRRNHKFGTYSFGMKQRLAIAGVLLADPEVLVLDEPTNGLDPKGIVEVRDIIKNVASTGKTVILASHLLDEVEKVCTHVAILKKGEMLSENVLDEAHKESEIILIEAQNQELLGKLMAEYELNSVRFNGVYWQADVPETFDTAALTTWLVEQNCPPTMIRKVKPKLEEAFMKVIGEGI